jgi:hypothetical protein
MKLSVTVDRDEDGMWVVECPSIPGCGSQSKTKAGALKNIKEAIALAGPRNMSPAYGRRAKGSFHSEKVVCRTPAFA